MVCVYTHARTPRKNDHMHELIHARLLDRTMTGIAAKSMYWLGRKLSLVMYVSICMYVLVQKQGSLARIGGRDRSAFWRHDHRKKARVIVVLSFSFTETGRTLAGT